MKRDEAIRLTEVIRVAITEAESSAQKATELLAYAKQSEAWRVMGYATFTEYVYTEFHIARNTAWKRLTQALVSGEVSEAAGVSEPIVLSQRQAQKLRPRLRAVKAQVQEATKGVPPPQRPAVVAEIVKGHMTESSVASVAPPPGYRLCPHCEGTGVVVDTSSLAVAQ